MLPLNESGQVYSTGDSAARKHFCPTAALCCFWMFLSYSSLCSCWMCLLYRRLSCLWTCLFYSSLSCLFICLFYSRLCFCVHICPVLPLDVRLFYSMQPVLLMNMSAVQPPVLPLDMSIYYLSLSQLCAGGAPGQTYGCIRSAVGWGCIPPPPVGLGR